MCVQAEETEAASEAAPSETESTVIVDPAQIEEAPAQ